MKKVIKYLAIFAFFSVLGWILEVIFRSAIAKEFVRPGFLHGFYLPIYGIGGIILFIGCIIKINFIKSSFYEKLFRIVILTILINIVEFVIGLISLYFFNKRYWDYSDQKYNILGIISLKQALMWLVGVTIYVVFLHKPFKKLVDYIIEKDYWYFIIGLFYGIIFVDFLSKFPFFKYIIK